MGDDMGGFKHGGPLMGYQDGRRPPLSPWPSKGPMSWKLHEPLIPRLPSHLRPTPAQLGTVGKIVRRLGLAGLLAEMLITPKPAGQDDTYFKDRDEKVWRDMMDERHGLGWSSDPVETPRINPGRRIDLSRVMRAGR